MKDACVVNALVAQVTTNWRSTQSPGSTLPLITQGLADPRRKYNTVFIELESQCVILLFSQSPSIEASLAQGDKVDDCTPRGDTDTMALH